MTRISGVPVVVRRASPDVYAVLLLVAILFLLACGVYVSWDLMQNYDYSIGQIFGRGTAPPQ